MTPDKRPAGTFTRGAVAGILTGGLALGIAQLVAGLISSGSSPVVAVGQLSIDFTPPAVKNFAISAFGSHDKIILVGGILVVLAVFAAVIGVLAVRRLSYGMTGLGLFILVGLIAALTRPNAVGSDALPTLVGGIAAALALRRLARLAAPAAAAVTPAPRAGTTPRPLPEYLPPAEQAPGTEPATGDRAAARPAASEPTASEPTADEPATSEPAQGPAAEGPAAEGPAAGRPSAGGPAQPEPGPPAGLPEEWWQPRPGRRAGRPGRPASGAAAS